MHSMLFATQTNWILQFEIHGGHWDNPMYNLCKWLVCDQSANIWLRHVLFDRGFFFVHVLRISDPKHCKFAPTPPLVLLYSILNATYMGMVCRVLAPASLVSAQTVHEISRKNVTNRPSKNRGGNTGHTVTDACRVTYTCLFLFWTQTPSKWKRFICVIPIPPPWLSATIY